MAEDPGVKAGDKIVVTIHGKKFTCAVTSVATCVFGGTLPEGYLDVTDGERDYKKGIRVGVKGALTPA